MKLFDTETCGKYGPIVLIQWAEYPLSEIHLHHVWTSPIDETLALIESLLDNPCAFNITFDWFHLCRLYTCLSILKDAFGGDALPHAYIQEFALCEPKARDGVCLKPTKPIDLMLCARKGYYQTTMNRDDIRIRRVPAMLAEELAAILSDRIQLKSFLFAKRTNKLNVPWQIFPTKDKDFVDVVLKFYPSGSLKAIWSDITGQDAAKFTDIQLPKNYMPYEVSFAPFALGVTQDTRFWTVKEADYKQTRHAWPAVIEKHIVHWQTNAPAIEYAKHDIVMLNDVYKHFGEPESSIDDVLACQGGASQWRGFALDLPKLQELMDQANIDRRLAPIGPTEAKPYLLAAMSDVEAMAIEKSTAKPILESIKKWTTPCPACASELPSMRDVGFEAIDTLLKGSGTCDVCHGSGVVQHNAAIRAGNVLTSRQANTKYRLLEKLKQAGRFHAAVSVIGSRSSRMSGRSESKGEGKVKGLNALGVQHDKETRSLFLFARPEEKASIGDFDAFEISIAETIYNDPVLRADLLSCAFCKHVRTPEQMKSSCPNCGRHDSLQKFHGLFAMALHPDKTYLEILATKGRTPDLYDEGKRGGFSQLYFGDANTLVTRLGVELEHAEAARKWFYERYPGVRASHEGITERFGSMKQPEGIGKRVYWHEPETRMQTLLGFERDFTLETEVCRELFKLANAPPKHWHSHEATCIRRERVQRVGGAVQSALYGCAFQIQAAVVRQAGNHEIQGTGAGLNKELQCELWGLQPEGVHPWRINLLNIHDELVTVQQPELVDVVAEIVDAFVVRRRSLIPLLSITWRKNVQSWSGK